MYFQITNPLLPIEYNFHKSWGPLSPHDSSLYFFIPIYKKSLKDKILSLFFRGFRLARLTRSLGRRSSLLRGHT